MPSRSSSRIKAAIAAVIVLGAALVGCSVGPDQLALPVHPDASPDTQARTDDDTDTGTESGVAPSPAPVPTATPDPRPPVFEPERRSATETFAAPETWEAPLELNPSVLRGELDNGLGYLVQANDRPGAQAQLRLVIQAGSIHEEPDALGAAHFLEHMMFNGTERFPGNEIITVLETFGSGFGPDINAYTGFEETVYELNVPTRDSAAIDLGFSVLVEWASAATIDPDAVAAERGVIVEEHRRRAETVGGRRFDALRSGLYAGTIHEGRMPIGTAESIASLNADDLRAYYDRWYRPDNMTVIAVGDFDAASMRDRIIDSFAAMEPRTPAHLAPVDGGPGGFSERSGTIFTDREVSRSTVDVLWRFAGRGAGEPISTAARHDDAVTDMAAMVVNARLFEQVHRGDLLLSAGFGRSGLPGHRSVVSLDAAGDPDQLDAVLEKLLTTIEQVRQHGLTDAEWKRAIESLRSHVDQSHAESTTRQDGDIAGDLITYSLGGATPLAPEMELTVSHEVIDALTVEQVQARLDEWLALEPLIFVGTSSDRVPAIPELFEVYDSIVGRQVIEPDRAAAAASADLMQAPEPAEIVDETSIGPLDATVVTFANGVRLAYRPTAVVDNSIEFRAWSRGGFFQEEAAVAPLVEMASDIVMASGFESIDVVELDRLAASRIVQFGGNVGRASESLSGSASTADLETLFQLIHLQFTEPTVSDVALRRFDQRMRPVVEDPTVNPTAAGNEALWRMRYGDSPYFRFLPTIEELDRLEAETVLAGWERRYANPADFVFVFVGDIDAAALRDLGARYLGSLATTDSRESAVDRDPGLPADNLVQIVRAGIGDKAWIRINWESPYPDTYPNQVAAQALEIIVNARLRDLIRERLGAAYAPRATVTLLDEPKDWIDTIIEVHGDPDRMAEISMVIHEELARLRAGDLDPGYLDRAIDQLDHDYRFFSNADWLELVTDAIVDSDSDPAGLWQRRALAEALTIDDIARTAQATFPPQRSVEVQLLPG